MTVKQFFKSETFKCLVVLLCIALVSGGLLSILNDVLYISDEERTMRAIQSIYGQEMQYEEKTPSETYEVTDVGYIENVYLLSDGNYLIKATGLHGYKDGTVTTWSVAVFENNTFKGLSSVSVADYDKQTLMGNFKDSFYNVYSSNNELIVSSDKVFSIKEDASSIKNVLAGASKSSNAINNAVNATLSFIRSTLV